MQINEPFINNNIPGKLKLNPTQLKNIVNSKDIVKLYPEVLEIVKLYPNISK